MERNSRSSAAECSAISPRDQPLGSSTRNCFAFSIACSETVCGASSGVSSKRSESWAGEGGRGRYADGFPLAVGAQFVLHELEARVEHGEGLAGARGVVAHVVLALVVLQQRVRALEVLLVSDEA